MVSSISHRSSLVPPMSVLSAMPTPWWRVLCGLEPHGGRVLLRPLVLNIEAWRTGLRRWHCIQEQLFGSRAPGVGSELAERLRATFSPRGPPLAAEQPGRHGPGGALQSCGLPTHSQSCPQVPTALRGRECVCTQSWRPLSATA